MTVQQNKQKAIKPPHSAPEIESSLKKRKDAMVFGYSENKRYFARAILYSTPSSIQGRLPTQNA